MYRINPSDGRKTASKSRDFMKNGGVNAYFSTILPVNADGYSKKSAFDQPAGVSILRAKVSR
jgi:hypothetical protein